jgi:hypothetical protein
MLLGGVDYLLLGSTVLCINLIYQALCKFGLTLKLSNNGNHFNLKEIYN